jgi:hypothetical protein
MKPRSPSFASFVRRGRTKYEPMRQVEVFISNGSDTNTYRNTAVDVLKRLQQLLQAELNYDVAITNWDYRLASPTLVPAGELAGPSLRVVDRSHACIAIFGRSCPRITRQEVREMLVRQQRGESVELFVFVDPKKKGLAHDQFFEDLTDAFGIELVWAPYSDPLSFQAILFTTLIGFLLNHLEIKNPALLGAA